MDEDDIRDPRVVPRWLPVGIHGVPRSREWDVVIQVTLPELADSTLAELSLKRLPDGAILVQGDGEIPAAALVRLTSVLADELQLDGAGEAVGVRCGVDDWSIAARQLRLDVVDLPDLGEVSEVSVAVTPDGERVVLVDGEEVDPDGALARDADVLEERGLARFDSFVARAERSGSAWELTLDPL